MRMFLKVIKPSVKLAMSSVTGGALLATLGAATLGMTPGHAEPPEAVVEAAGPWSCDMPDVEVEPGPVFDPLRARLMAGVLLAAHETALGIRPDQMDAWRAYSSALAAMIPSGDRLERWRDTEKRSKAEAFALVQDIAAAALERARKAERLQETANALKASLSPEQLSLAGKMQVRLVERIARFVGRHGESFGAPL